MRVFWALLLLGGGGIAALAVSWFFYSTSVDEQDFNSSATTQLDSQQENQQVPRTDAVSEGASETVAQAKDTQGQDEDRLAGLPRVEIARIGPDGSAVLAGKADAGATITITENGTVLGTGKADNTGDWVSVLETRLSAGNHLLIIEMLTSDGQVRRDSRAVLVELQEQGEEAPLVALVPMDENAQQQAELLSAPSELSQPAQNADVADSAESTEISQTEQAASHAENAALFIDTLSWISDNDLRVRGSARSGERVSVQFDGIDTSADYDKTNKKWTAEISLSDRTQRLIPLEAYLYDNKGNILLQRRLDIAPSQLDIGRDGSEMVVVTKGDMLWRIAYRTYGKGIRYLDIVKRNQGRIEDPDMIFPAQIFALPEEN